MCKHCNNDVSAIGHENLLIAEVKMQQYPNSWLYDQIGREYHQP